MKKLLLFLTISFSLTVAYGQLYPIKNLIYQQWYVFPNFNVCPAYNCFDLSWSEPDSNTVDTLIGYNIYKNGIFYRFLTCPSFGCSGNVVPGCNQNSPNWYNNMPFWVTVKAVYNKDSAVSVSDTTILIGDIYIGINEIMGIKSCKITPNPFSLQTTIVIDYPCKNATLTLFNVYGQILKQKTNISEQSIILNRENLSSGLYFLRLTQDNIVISTDKLVIIDN